MKTILLVAVAAMVGSIASDKIKSAEFFTKSEFAVKNSGALGIGMTAGIGALTFGLLTRML